MRYAVFVLNRNSVTSVTQRFRVEKVTEKENALDLQKYKKIPNFTDFFFFGCSDLESEEEILKSIEISNGAIIFNKIDIEKNTIYILGHEFQRYGAVFNPITGASINKQSFSPFNVVVIENC